MSDAPARSVALPTAWLASPAAKAGLILVLLLLMQIPLYTIGSLIDERQARQDTVEGEFRSSWGPVQTVTGPALAVPYTAPETGPDGKLHVRRGWVEIPPAQLNVAAAVTPETRHRGLFEAVVYTATLDLNGTLAVPQVDVLDAPNATLLWDRAVLAMGASDLRGQPPGSTAQIGDAAVPLTLQPPSESCGAVALAPLHLASAPAVGTTLPFRTKLVLRGTQALHMTPLGQQMDVQVGGPWPSPSFTDATLPMSSQLDIGHSGEFNAHWQLAGDALTAAPRTTGAGQPLCAASQEAAQGAALGVALLQPVPTYLMVSRAQKYGALFLALSFLTYFLFEMLTGVRIHVAQYALLGASVSLFSLLLVALAEPLGFTAGYALSTAAIMAQASLYTLSVVGAPRLAALFAALLGLLFGFLYVVLRLESYALLCGTVALFAGLSVVMLVTRRVDWDRAQPQRQAARGVTQGAGQGGGAS